ncbi:hypothetical protein Lal_00021425 [Lupinus albus]|nr:hypothetical protein Lal_00021425 [Lupinus albus]
MVSMKPVFPFIQCKKIYTPCEVCHLANHKRLPYPNSVSESKHEIHVEPHYLDGYNALGHGMGQFSSPMRIIPSLSFLDCALIVPTMHERSSRVEFENYRSIHRFIFGDVGYLVLLGKMLHHLDKEDVDGYPRRNLQSVTETKKSHSPTGRYAAWQPMHPCSNLS